MSAPDPWRVPELQRLGQRFRALERRENAARLRKRRRRLVGSGAIFAAGVASVLVLAVGGAGASSAVNAAPGAAIRAGSARITSTIVAAVGGETRRRYDQASEVDFRTGAYRTRLTTDRGRVGREWRSIRGSLYLGIIGTSSGARVQTQWFASRLSRTQRAMLTTVPAGDALTDPFALLRVLANVRSPARLVRQEEVGGASLRAYEVATTLSALLLASSPTIEVREQYRRIRAELTVWIDALGRPVRVVEKLSGTSGHVSAVLEDTTSFLEYGAPVRLTAPAGAVVAGKPLEQVPSSLVAGPTRWFEGLLQDARKPVG